MKAADKLCQICFCPAHEVGVLSPGEATYRTGDTSIVQACDGCFEWTADYPGWLRQNCDLIRLERIGRASSMPQPVRDAAIIGEIRAFEGRVLTEHFGGFAS